MKMQLNKFYLIALYWPYYCLEENMTSQIEIATVQEKAICVLWFFETQCVTKSQRRYRTQYGKYPPSDNVIRRWFKQFQETGSVAAAIETDTPQMLESTWREIEYGLDISRATKGAH
jgi:hypothetical protein